MDYYVTSSYPAEPDVIFIEHTDTQMIIKIIAIGLDLEDISINIKKQNGKNRTTTLQIDLPRHELFGHGRINSEFDITEILGDHNPKEISAELEKGLLTITIPKNVVIERVKIQ